MKFLFLLTIALISLNTFSSELGEDQKSPCPFAVQSNSREAKPVVVENNVDTEQVEKEVKAIAK